MKKNKKVYVLVSYHGWQEIIRVYNSEREAKKISEEEENFYNMSEVKSYHVLFNSIINKNHGNGYKRKETIY